MFLVRLNHISEESFITRWGYIELWWWGGGTFLVMNGGVKNIKYTWGRGGKVIYFVRYLGSQMCSTGLCFHKKS